MLPKVLTRNHPNMNSIKLVEQATFNSTQTKQQPPAIVWYISRVYYTDTYV